MYIVYLSVHSSSAVEESLSVVVKQKEIEEMEKLNEKFIEESGGKYKLYILLTSAIISGIICHVIHNFEFFIVFAIVMSNDFTDLDIKECESIKIVQKDNSSSLTPDITSFTSPIFHATCILHMLKSHNVLCM